MAGSGWEAIMEGRKWSKDLLERSGVIGRPSRRAGCCLEAFPKTRVTFPNGQEWWRGPPEGPGVVGRPSRRAESGREALT